MERIYEKDSNVQRVTARVLGCRAAEGGCEVELDQTIFYPGGGGQPEDRGTVGGLPVLGFRKRESGDVAHLLSQPVSGEVELVLDWPRRFDHMQQHTAQHLITVTAWVEFGLKTIAFHIGEELCDIEFDASRVGRDVLDRLEARVNERIAEARAVRITSADRDALDRGEVRSRLLPDDLAGPLRIVEIDGLDRNTCGGTHVSNLAELRAVKLLHTEKLSRGTRAYYVAGGRVLRQLSTLLERQEELTAALQCGPEQHLGVVGNLLVKVKESDRRARQLLFELGQAVAQGLVREAGPVVFLHSPDGDAEFVRAVASVISERRPDLTAILVVGRGEPGATEPGNAGGQPWAGGHFAVVGPAEKVAELGPRVMALLAGKGGGRGTLFQGKAGSLERLEEVRGLVG
jgi:misacylated tRNA(Ala) deacylase